MFELSVLGVFLTASVALILSPGPDSVYVLTRSIASGQATGLAAALGTSTGILVHTTAAVLGLSILLRTSALAFAVVRYAGAIYLIYLGIQTIRHREAFDLDTEKTEYTTAGTFAGGLTVNVLNPQVALFFLAFLPQFVGPGASASIQMGLLGALYSLLTITYLGSIAVLSTGVRHLIERRPATADAIRWATGTILVGFGLQLLLSDRTPA
jgi:threonine/homoserine/homoserine lactone efflux protein